MNLTLYYTIIYNFIINNIPGNVLFISTDIYSISLSKGAALCQLLKAKVVE